MVRLIDYTPCLVIAALLFLLDGETRYIAAAIVRSVCISAPMVNLLSSFSLVLGIKMKYFPPSVPDPLLIQRRMTKGVYFITDILYKTPVKMLR